MTPLLLVDGHHLLYRSWWGFSDRRILSRDKQRDLTAVFGFLAVLRKTHIEEVPDHEIIVVFDGENAIATRQPQDATYKANRATADHAPIHSLPAVKDALTHLGVPWLGYIHLLRQRFSMRSVNTLLRGYAVSMRSGNTCGFVSESCACLFPAYLGTPGWR